MFSGPSPPQTRVIEALDEAPPSFIVQTFHCTMLWTVSLLCLQVILLVAAVSRLPLNLSRASIIITFQHVLQEKNTAEPVDR